LISKVPGRRWGTRGEGCRVCPFAENCWGLVKNDFDLGFSVKLSSKS